ncbi:MAG: methyltransferase domain-containing protein, partial [Planctomycetota bacterium]|nr:methyltransferase domain-containing protein [Planctomycetota bacterium]
MSSTWDPSQYERFAEPRLRPGLELLARIPVEAPRRVVDLGCGTGNLTAALAARWPEAEVVGVDHSAEMLERAGEVAPAVRFEEGDAETYCPPPGTDIL